MTRKAAVVDGNSIAHLTCAEKTDLEVIKPAWSAQVAGVLKLPSWYEKTLKGADM